MRVVALTHFRAAAAVLLACAAANVDGETAGATIVDGAAARVGSQRRELKSHSHRPYSHSHRPHGHSCVHCGSSLHALPALSSYPPLLFLTCAVLVPSCGQTTLALAALPQPSWPCAQGAPTMHFATASLLRPRFPDLYSYASSIIPQIVPTRILHTATHRTTTRHMLTIRTVLRARTL